MPNLTPRIIGLAQNGFDPTSIAHMLGITFAQVEEGLKGKGVTSLAEPRWLIFDASLPSSAASAIGIEGTIPVFPADLWESEPYIYGTVDSSPILAVPAGDVAIQFNNVILTSARGNDTITPKFDAVLAELSTGEWCRVGLHCPALTVAAHEHTFAEEDLHIINQSAADFSISGTGIKSATGGTFLCTVALEGEGELDA